MKKLLSLITALIMLLSLAGATAEGATEATISVTLDAEAIGNYVQLLGEVTGEEEMAAIYAILELVNHSSAVITGGETGAALSLRLKDAEVAGFRINASESEVALSSNLFPGYVITVDPGILEELAGASGMEMSTQSMMKAMELLMPYSEEINLALGQITADAQSEAGTFSPDGDVVYTQRMTALLTSHTVLPLVRGLLTRLQQDQELLALIEPLMAQAGEEINLAEQLTQVLSQTDAMLTQEPVSLAELTLYTNETGSYFKLQSVNQEDMSFLLTIKSTTEQDGSTSQLSLTVAAEQVTDWETARQAISGQSMDGLVLESSLDSHALAAGVQTNGSLQILAAGMNVGLSLDSFTPADTSEATVAKIGLSLGGTAPLVVLQFSLLPAAAGAEAIDLDGKTKIAVSADTKEEDFLPLLTELIGIGLPGIITVITEQMPEVTGALLAIGMPRSSEPVIVPEETVPEPTQEATVATEAPVTGETTAATEAPLVEETGPGKLAVTQASFQVQPYSSYYQGAVYAQLTNTGTTPVEFDSGTLELLDAAGSIIGSTDLYYCYPEVLAPGETGYLYASISVEEAVEPSYIAGYNLTVNGREEISKDVVRLPSTGAYEEIADGYWTTYYLSAVVENDTDTALYDVEIVYALKDAGGNLLYVTQSSPYGVGIMPYTSVGIRTSLYSDYLDYFTANNLIPATVDTIAYISSYK